MTLHLVKAAHDRRRGDLREAVGRMATAIAHGEIAPTPCELEALAQICAEHFLPVEAARIRRWIAGTAQARPEAG
jgi:hypothetical protein